MIPRCWLGWAVAAQPWVLLKNATNVSVFTFRGVAAHFVRAVGRDEGVALWNRVGMGFFQYGFCIKGRCFRV